MTQAVFLLERGQTRMVGGLAVAVTSFVARTNLLYVEPGFYWDG